VVGALVECGLEVWVVSGGLADAVVPFAADLGVGADRVRAVTIDWNGADPYRSAEDHPLARGDGKLEVIRELAKGAPVVMVGDGASDLAARDAVRCFIGFGGVVVRDPVREAADAWIESESLAPVVPLVTGEWGRDRLRGSIHAGVWERGESLWAAGEARGGCPALDVQEIVAS
jgi:phosphoserine phosphatase